MKIAVILGTRPEIIKLSPIIRGLEKRHLDYFIIHTNQHYSPELDRIFFKELNLPLPRYNLKVTGETEQGAMVAKMILALEPILQTEKPDWVLVQGDTNSVLAGALCSAKLGIKIGHVEAGLRSYDRTMPEELNRLITDHLSNALFCPTESALENARGEGIDFKWIHVTGNTIVDAVRENEKLISTQLNDKYATNSYMLLTMHRAGNVDHKETLTRLINTVQELARESKLPLLFPVHPHTKASIKNFGIDTNPRYLQMMEPVGYLEMLSLMKNAKLIITDSGGLQEEACILRVPCITIRENTERPETVTVGANKIVGSQPEDVIMGGLEMMAKTRTWTNPFGEGDAAGKIINIILKGE